jgi:transcriptional regulator with XRE-family HTH domain
MLSFGQRVYQQRLTLRMTQKEFADLTKISKRHLQLIESGKANPTIEMARRIKNVCDCSWDDLLGKA